MVSQGFNPRAHAGRDEIEANLLRRCSCFNPHAHAGRDSPFLLMLLWVLMVSIHAPTRGATQADRGRQTEAGGSIHAPTRGATKD